MKRYLVKQTSIATQENLNFAGKIQVSFHGRGDHFAICNKCPMWLVKEYGYKRKYDVERNWTYKNPENSRYWKSTVEIVEVEIE